MGLLRKKDCSCGRSKKKKYRWGIVVVCLMLAGCQGTSSGTITDVNHDLTKESILETTMDLMEESTFETNHEMVQETSPAVTEAVDNYEASLQQLASFQVGSTAPQITERSASWYADLDHDGVDERILFDWCYLDIGTPGIFAVLESDGSVVYLDEWIGTSHVGWMTYYVCQREGKEYLLQYVPYEGTGWGSYYYSLMELTADGQIQIVQQDETEFRGDPVEYIVQTWPDYKMDIEDMAVFAERLNELLDVSYLLVSTDKGWMDQELDYYEKHFVLGNPQMPYRQYEDYHGLLRKTQEVEKPEMGMMYQWLKEWCEDQGMPYKK